MKVLCILLGILLLFVGIGIRVLVDNDPATSTMKGKLEVVGIEKINPSIAAALLHKGIGTEEVAPITMEQILDGTDPIEAKVVQVVLQIYAHSTAIIILGAFLLIYGATMKKRPAE
jgi:hypothetical protein